MMRDVFKQVLTQADNLTFSTPRLTAAVILILYVGLSIADFIVNRKFDAQAYGLGAAAVVGAVGVAIKLGEPASTPPAS